MVSVIKYLGPSSSLPPEDFSWVAIVESTSWHLNSWSRLGLMKVVRDKI